MVRSIVPCLWFDGNAEEATTFYVSLFDDAATLDISRFGEAGPGKPGTVISTRFRLQGQEFMTLNGGPEFRFNEAISFFIECDTAAEVDRLWDALVAGGEPGRCGWLKDRFGVSWQVVPAVLGELLADPDRARADRVMRAMLQMSKIDTAALLAAHNGQ